MFQQENGNEVVFWLKVNQEALSNCRREKVNTGTLQLGILYIDLVNLSIPGNAFRLNRPSQGLETLLANSSIVAEAKRPQLNKKGRQEFLDSYKKIAILRNDITSVQ